MRGKQIYIYQQSDWPHFIWDAPLILPLLGTVRNQQGKLTGRMESLGFDFQNEANFETLTTEILKTSEIEGEILNVQQVRSSLAHRLGLEISGVIPSDRNVDGIVDMMMDANQNFNEPLTRERLFGWHASLFSTGRSGMFNILTGVWRDDSTGPMQVISGAMGKEKVHYEAPEASALEKEMLVFIEWFNSEKTSDPVIKAGIAHLWFLTIHPFEDGNGRIARALTDMLLARSDGLSQRFYSMSAQIQKERNAYYDILEKTQKGSLDITSWLKWFLNCLMSSLKGSEKVTAQVLTKHKFWATHTADFINSRQKLIINKLFDGFEGNLTSSKWAKIAKCSTDTALRDIHDLIGKNILRKKTEGGRSTAYELVQIK